MDIGGEELAGPGTAAQALTRETAAGLEEADIADGVNLIRGRVVGCLTGVNESSPRVMSTAPVAWIFPEGCRDPSGLHGYGHWPRDAGMDAVAGGRRAAAGGEEQAGGKRGLPGDANQRERSFLCKRVMPC